MDLLIYSQKLIDDLMTRQSPQVLAAIGFTAAFSLAIGFLGLFFLRRSYKGPKPFCDLPVLNLKEGNFDQAKLDYITNLGGLLDEGRKNHRYPGFQLWTPEDRFLVFLPEENIEEVKALTDDIARNCILETAFGDPMWVRLKIPVITRLVLHKLSPRLSLIMNEIFDEIDYALDQEIGACEDWTDVYIFPKLIRIVAIISGRAFVGKSLNRREAWLNAQMGYTLDLFNAAMQVRQYPRFLQWIKLKLGHFDGVKKVYKWQAEARKLIVPTIKYRQQEKRRYPKNPIPNDMIQWMMEAAPLEQPPLDDNTQADVQLLIGLASVHTTSVATTHCLYDMIYRPGYIDSLRDEVDQVWKEDRGHMTKTSLHKLVKLDSFMKESQRINGNNLVTFNREITTRKGFTLSSGIHLPYKSQFAFAPQQASLDPTNYDDPQSFKGFRFADLRAKEESRNKYQYVTTNKVAMHFGHGVHACPGRFLAGNEIKVILSWLLRRYEIRAPEGSNERPKNSAFGMEVSPDMGAKLCFRRRQKPAATPGHDRVDSGIGMS